MGGCRMGADPKTSMLNAWNQLHAVPNVFVTDGACMTSTGNQSPSILYMALTARAVNHAVDEMSQAEPVTPASEAPMNRRDAVKAADCWWAERSLRRQASSGARATRCTVQREQATRCHIGAGPFTGRRSLAAGDRRHAAPDTPASPGAKAAGVRRRS